MGLSSSQGRLLMLTSRLSDIQLQETLISQKQNQLAMDSIQASDKYNEAMSNTKLVLKMPDENSSTGTKDAMFTYQNLIDMNYLIVDASNNLYLTQDEDGEWQIPTTSDGEALVNIDGNVAYINNATGDDNISFNIKNGDQYLKKSSTLQNAIMNANLFVLDISREEPKKVEVDCLESDTSVYYELDTSDDAQAESEYNTTLARISRQDKMLETEVKQLETQHEAVLKELDSVKNVISNNVDRTFKLFSNG